jgi:hypothetical protein
MMDRRRFLTALAALPFLRRLAPRPVPVLTTTASEYLRRYYSPVMVPFPFAGDPKFYGGMALLVSGGGSSAGTVTMEVSRDGETWWKA